MTFIPCSGGVPFAAVYTWRGPAVCMYCENNIMCPCTVHEYVCHTYMRMYVHDDEVGVMNQPAAPLSLCSTVLQKVEFQARRTVFSEWLTGCV